VIKGGQTWDYWGPIGSGKSTVANLLDDMILLKVVYLMVNPFLAYDI
jgi:deoxyadenosine/deoxycytidine kinase